MVVRKDNLYLLGTRAPDLFLFPWVYSFLIELQAELFEDEKEDVRRQRQEAETSHS